MDLTEVALLPLPLPLIASFAELRDRVMAGTVDIDTLSGETTGKTATQVEVPKQGTWTKAMLEELHDRLRYPLVLHLLELCSTRPGEWVAKAEVDERSANGPLQLRNELGAFSKLVKKLFGQVQWPMEYVKQDGVYLYRMPPAMAELWIDVTRGGPR